jgi:MoaA/NifB/PqqE/SkfB family radical SAM enzyme
MSEMTDWKVEGKATPQQEGDLIREIRRLLDFIHPAREQFQGTICHQCPEFEQCMWEQRRCYRDAYFCYGTVYGAPPLCPYNSRSGLRLS